MILEGIPDKIGFEKRMLQENEVHGLLPFSSVWQNDQIQLWYDISGRKSLRDYMEQEQPLTVPFLKRLLNQLSALSEECSRYLLNPIHICMNPDTVYIDGRNDSFTVHLCYCPLEMNSHGNGMLAVMEYLISVVDHGNEELCRICYDLYDAAAEDSCSIRKLCDIADEAVGREKQEEFQVDERGVNVQDSKNPPDRLLESNRQIPSTTMAAIPFHKSFFSRTVQKIRHFLKILLRTESKKAADKKKQFFPEKTENETTLVFDLDEETENDGTVLLNGPANQEAGSAGKEISGILRYEGTEDIGDVILNQPVITIGSAADNAVVLKIPSISRHHARIYRNNDDIYLEDLNSLNGTRIENEYLAVHEKRKLEPGKRIFFAAEPFLVV